MPIRVVSNGVAPLVFTRHRWIYERRVWGVEVIKHTCRHSSLIVVLAVELNLPNAFGCRSDIYLVGIVTTIERAIVRTRELLVAVGDVATFGVIDDCTRLAIRSTPHDAACAVVRSGCIEGRRGETEMLAGLGIHTERTARRERSVDSRGCRNEHRTAAPIEVCHIKPVRVTLRVQILRTLCHGWREVEGKEGGYQKFRKETSSLMVKVGRKQVHVHHIWWRIMTYAKIAALAV